MFKSLKRLAENAKRLNQSEIFITVISKNGISTFIADLNRGQLIEGEGADGNNLLRYVDDPFFKSKAQALAYQKWKERISPSGSKPKDVADFYINGYFHNSIYTKIDADYFSLKSDVDFANDIMRKEKDALGLNNESNRKLVEKILPMVIEETRKAIRG